MNDRTMVRTRNSTMLGSYFAEKLWYDHWLDTIPGMIQLSDIFRETPMSTTS